jgi:hypothetical protein
MKTKARLDADRTAKPKSSIVGHAKTGDCVGPNITIPDEYRNDDGARVPLGREARIDIAHAKNGPIHREFEAWRQIRKQLDRVGVSLVDEIAVIRAILAWGEELVSLRTLFPEDIPEMLEKRRKAYEVFKIKDGEP